jgi:hypothetical protein
MGGLHMPERETSSRSTCDVFSNMQVNISPLFETLKVLQCVFLGFAT